MSSQSTTKAPKDYSQPETYPVLVDFEAGKLDAELNGDVKRRHALLALVRRTESAEDRELILREMCASISHNRWRRQANQRANELATLLAASRPEVPDVLQFLSSVEHSLQELVRKTESVTAALKKSEPGSRAVDHLHWLEHETYLARDGVQARVRSIQALLTRPAEPAAEASESPADGPGEPT